MNFEVTINEQKQNFAEFKKQVLSEYQALQSVYDKLLFSYSGGKEIELIASDFIFSNDIGYNFDFYQNNKKSYETYINFLKQKYSKLKNDNKSEFSIMRSLRRTADVYKRVFKKFIIRNLRLSFRHLVQLIFKNMDDNSGEINIYVSQTNIECIYHQNLILYGTRKKRAYCYY